MASQRLEKLQQYLKESPNDVFLLYAIASEYSQLGHKKEAAKRFEHLRRQEPDYLATYYHYGKLLEELDQPELALTVYREGIDLAERQNDSRTLRELQEAFNLLSFELED